MITRDDLKVIDTLRMDGFSRDTVQHNNRTFWVEAADNFQYIQNNDDPAMKMLYMFGQIPDVESLVIEAKDDGNGHWVPLNECGPQCETGLCNKRLASRNDVNDLDVAYGMLLDALNA